MMMDVDNVLDERIDPYELEKLYEAYHVQCRRGSPSAMAKFSYAHGLVKSNLSDVRDGVDILEDLLRNDESEKSRRDYVYYLAIAHARLKEYDRSLAYLDILRSTDGTTRQVKHLQDLIDERMRRDGLIGMGILGGGLAVAGILAAALISVMRR